MSEVTPNERRSPPPEAMSVSEVTARVKETLEGRFADVWVAGEVSNLTKASSGHIYFSLKDESSLLRGVVWRGTVPLLAIEPADGLEVVCHGRLEVYAPRGTYQLTVDRLHAVGTGSLEARLRKLHAQLEREGLFAPGRKRRLPSFPRRIAVVTSPAGAAIADFMETFFARWRGCELIVVPSRVQGAGAAEELAAALAIAGRIAPAVDAIALIRGGGSLEDLWAFNEEVLVRAVAASPVPVVSGVGHEIDVSLADLAADLRALTPTDAAVRIAPDGRQLAAGLESSATRLRAGLKRRIETARERIARFAGSRVLGDPTWLVRDRRAAIGQQAARLRRLALLAVDRAGERLRAAVGRLEAGSPLKLLARGYSVTSLDGRLGPLVSTSAVQPGDLLVTQLADGRVWSTASRIVTASLGPTEPPPRDADPMTKGTSIHARRS